MIAATFIFAAVCAFLLPFHTQAELIVLFEDVLWPTVNKEYFTEPDTYVVDDHPESVFLNYSVIKQIPETSRLHCTLLGALRGAYVLNTGIDITSSVCETVKSHNVFSHFLNHFGFTDENCLASPGVHGAESIQVPSKYLPERFAPNKYLVNAEIIDGINKLLAAEIYINVQ